MVNCIIVDKEGLEISREVKNKGYRPLNGYQRQKDGSYIKQFGDPRIIPTEKLIELVELEKIKIPQKVEQQDIVQHNFANNKKIIDDIIFVKVKFKLTWPQLTKNITYDRTNFRGNLSTYKNVTFKILFDVTELDHIITFNKFEVEELIEPDSKRGLFRFFGPNNYGDIPDYVILDAMTF